MLNFLTTTAPGDQRLGFKIKTFSILISEEDISNELANYMTMTLDLNVANLASYMNRTVPNYDALINELDAQLETKLKASNITILELFHRLAIR